jgi:solute carrier family 45 protein 1/2/4
MSMSVFFKLSCLLIENK